MRILVVDDNQDAADTLMAMLRDEHHEVITAYNGHQAIAYARANSPRVVILDIGMPGMSGYDLAVALRKEPCCEGAILIAVTAYADAQSLRTAAESGVDLHFKKPVEWKQFVHALKEISAATDGPVVSGPRDGDAQA